LAVRYDLHPSLIAMVQENPFLGEGWKSLHPPMWFQKTLFYIQGMRRVTLKWKLFPFSLTGKARRWYTRYVGSVNREWEKLQAKFCLTYFPISYIAHLRRDILNFQQKREGVSRCGLGTTYRFSIFWPRFSYNWANAYATFLSRS
jgi:hypothetical protein